MHKELIGKICIYMYMFVFKYIYLCMQRTILHNKKKDMCMSSGLTTVHQGWMTSVNIILPAMSINVTFGNLFYRQTLHLIKKENNRRIILFSYLMLFV